MIDDINQDPESRGIIMIIVIVMIIVNNQIIIIIIIMFEETKIYEQLVELRNEI